MATTKKTVKSDATDKKKTATSKKTTTTKKKTTVKKEVESTGVVDEFLNENIGKVVTETPKPEKKATTKKKPTPKAKKTDENKLIDAEAELNGILSQQITEENIRVADEIEKSISKQKELVVKPTDDDVKAPEEKWKELGLTNELQADIQKTVSELYNTDTTIEVVDEKDKPKDVVYPPIVDNIEPQEKQKTPTVDDLKVDLQTKPQQNFTYVNISMGVKYD